ncbi:MAG TPA: tetratricopeptide repeat protein [Vicinamibacteria bacterium]
MRRILAAALLIVSARPLRADTLSDALEAGRFTEALRLADAGLKSEPGNARLWTIRAIALERLARLPQSLASFERALTLDPDSVAALKGATEVAYRTHSPKAARYVQRVLAREPGDETAHAMAGALAVEADSCAEAVAHFARSGPALLENRPALAQYAGCLLRLKRPREAGDLFQRLVETSPADPAARYNLAVCRLEAGQVPEAAAAAGAGLALSPADSELLNVFAAASAAAGQLEPAIAALRKATEVAPADERHYLDLAALCLEHDALDLALDVVNTGLANIPASARLYTMRGAIRAERAEVDEAMRDFERARALRPDELYGSVGLSLVLRQADRLPEAIALLRQKLVRHPRDATLNYLLADALLRTDPGPASAESAEARAALERSLQARPDFAKAHANLGRLQLRAGEVARAVDQLRAAVRLDPNDRLALNQLVVAYRRLGRDEDAAAVAGQLKKLLETERAEEIARNRVRLYRAPRVESR